VSPPGTSRGPSMLLDLETPSSFMTHIDYYSDGLAMTDRTLAIV